MIGNFQAFLINSVSHYVKQHSCLFQRLLRVLTLPHSRYGGRDHATLRCQYIVEDDTCRQCSRADVIVMQHLQLFLMLLD